MTAFYLIQPISHTVIFTLILMLLVINLYTFFISLIRTKRYKACFITALPITLCYITLVLLTTAVYEYNTGLIIHPLIYVFARLPVIIYIIFILLTAALTLLLLYREMWYLRNTITKASIKESIDNLPTGVCFSTDSGVILLSNNLINNLCHALTGSDLQDSGEFWHAISNGKLQGGASLVSGAKHPIIHLPNGQLWSFARNTIQVDSGLVIQITAFDTTDLDALRIHLQHENKTLTEMNARLRLYAENIIETVSSKERLATKIRLHNELGHTLITMRHLLSQGEYNDESHTILDLWRRNVSILKGGTDSEPENSWHKLILSAKDLGVSFIIESELEISDIRSTLIIATAIEALNNAVRHAQATILRLSLTENDTHHTAIFTNDGKPPDKPITEGGGLSALRRRIEGNGGNMQIISHPIFKMTVNLPKCKEQHDL